MIVSNAKNFGKKFNIASRKAKKPNTPKVSNEIEKLEDKINNK